MALLVVLAVLAVIVGLTVMFAALIVMLVQRSKAKSADGVPQAPIGPGWYPAPDDAQLLRWFDGTTWTPETRPRQ